MFHPLFSKNIFASVDIYNIKFKAYQGWNRDIFYLFIIFKEVFILKAMNHGKSRKNLSFDLNIRL